MIRLFDKDSKIIKYISEGALLTVHQNQRLTDEGYISEQLNVQMNILDDDIFNGAEYMTIPAKGHDTLHHLFWIKDKHSDNRFTHFTGVLEGIEELSKTPIIDVRPANTTIRQAAEQALADTNYIVRFAADTGRRSSNAYFTDVWSALKRYAAVWRVEMQLFVEVTETGIGARYIDFREQIGVNNGARVVYGHNALEILKEEDRAEIYTALIGRGNGEEVGETEDGDATFGRKINFKDIEWKKSDGNPLDKPLGQYYLELPEATQLYGIKYGNSMKPKIGFVDVDTYDEEELLELTHEALLQVSRPKVMFRASAVYLKGDIGDTVRVVRKDRGIDYDTRIFDITHDRLENSILDIKLGDNMLETQAARERRITGKVAVRVEEQINNNLTEHVQYIVSANGLNRNYYTSVDPRDEGFNPMLNDIWYRPDPDSEGDTIFYIWNGSIWEEVGRSGARALEQLRQEIETNISNTRSEMEQEFNAEVERIEQEALAEYDRISGEITGSIDQARSDIEQDYSQAVLDARDYAEQQAEQHANVVDSKLETMRDTHAGLIQQNQNNIANVNDFIGDKTVGLNELLYNERMLFEERINSINTWHYNLLRESQTLDEDFWEARNGTIVIDEGGDSYYRADVRNVVERTLRSKQAILFEEGETYTLSFQVQTYGHRSMDYIWIIGDDPNIFDGNYPLSSRADEQTADVMHWGSQYRTYYVTFTMQHDVYGVLQIGGDYRNNDLGAREYRIKKPYLTQSDNKQWLHNPEDSLQNLEEVTKRVTELEDGWETLITRTEYDFDTNEIRGTIRSIEDTVDGYSSTISNHENWILTNGSSIERTVDGFDSKVWLSDIHNPNMFSYTDVTLVEHRRNWSGWNTSITGSAYNEFMRVRNTNSASHIGIISSDVELVSGVEYTFSWVGFTYGDSVIDAMNYTYVFYPGNPNQSVNASSGTRTVVPTNPGSYGGRTLYKYTRTFTARHTGPAQIMIGGYTASSGIDASFSFKEPKLELGNRATPYYTAFSGLTQRVDEISLLVQDIDGSGLVRQSDITVSSSSVRIGSTEILGDDVLSSILNVSPNAIDMITQKMRLSGDLYVDGDITALAIEVVEADIGRVFANTANIDFIRARHMNANSVGAKHLYVDNALINKLSASSIFTDMLSTKTLNAIDANIGEVRASMLTTNTITSGMIQSSNATINKLFSNNARIDTLVSKAHFVDQIEALSINAFEGEFGRLFATEFAAITIDVDKISGNTSNFIQSNWNSISGSVRITSNGLETYVGSQLTSLLSGTGHAFYENGVYTGQIGTTYIVGNRGLRGLRFNASDDAEYLTWSKGTSSTGAEILMSWFRNGTGANSKGFNFFDTAQFNERIYSNKRIYANSGVYFDEDDNSLIARTGTNLVINHNNNASNINLFESGTISFSSYGSTTHAFFTDGTKTGGSIEIDGTRYGMSPIDSPQVLIEYIEFDVELSRFGTKVMLDETYLKSVTNFAVFLNNGELASKGTDHIVVKGEGAADIRFVGERIEHNNVMWADMRTEESVEVIEHESKEAPRITMERT